MSFTIAPVAEGDLPELLALMRGYCAFYEETAGAAQPSDEALLAMSRALLADPEREGVQLIAWSDEDGTPLGFATVFWTWSTLSATAPRSASRPSSGPGRRSPPRAWGR
jgi:hypothetical protein